MAIKLILRAINSPVKGNVKLVLIALADYADKDGWCYPGVKKLSEKCGISPTTTKKCTSILKELGYVIKKRRFNTSNIYKIRIPKRE